MPEIRIKQVEAFSTIPFAGNPAGVITDADGLSTEDMMAIAGEMNMAETAFITMPSSSASLDSSFRIRFFTPTGEVGLSGHVTIASCFALIEDGRIELDDGINTVLFETNVGPISVDVHFTKNGTVENGEDLVPLYIDGKHSGVLNRIMMHQSIDGFQTPKIPVDEIAGILGVDRGEISGTGLPVEIIATGLDQLMVPLQRKETLASLNPDLIKLALMNREHGIELNHIFTLDTYSEQCITYARNFAPVLGMWEDPATGTASAGLGSYLCRHAISHSRSMMMEQGNDPGTLARIQVEVESIDGDSAKVQVGGLAVTSMTRTIDIEPIDAGSGSSAG